MNKRSALLSRAKVLSAAFSLIAASPLGVGEQALADQVHLTIKAVGGTGYILNLPISDAPVILTCASTAANDAGTGQATLVYSTAAKEIFGNGYDYTGSFNNFSSGTQTHLMYCDHNSTIEITSFHLTQLELGNKGVSQTVVLMFTY